jgi:pimeloyl-ACP methyl ester carboxylesterase
MKNTFALIAAFSLLVVPSAMTQSAPANTSPLILLGPSGTATPVKTLDVWARRKPQIAAAMQEVMGPLPDVTRKVPFELRVENETDCGAYIRKSVSFTVEDWDRLPALLLVPKSLHGKAPALLCLHPTSELGKAVVCGQGTQTNRNYGQELAARGYVVLAPDYPGFGDYAAVRKELYGHGYVSASMKGVWNHMRCVDLLQSLPEVDPERIGCIGHSLGGHNTLFLGVFDPRVKVLVSSCGFTSFPKYYAGDLTGWTHPGYMPAIDTVYAKDPARMPFDFPGVLAALAPRPLFVNAPLHDANFDVSGVKDCVNTARTVYSLYHAKQKLVAAYPDAEHDFPEPIRKEAYAFIDAVLKH